MALEDVKYCRCMMSQRRESFYNLAGTGKTLVARALASHASKAGKKVSFFMRKGADILSKWVGEAERQLRLLFEEAQKAQPAIIFFDEIDGIAPVLETSCYDLEFHACLLPKLCPHLILPVLLYQFTMHTMLCSFFA